MRNHSATAADRRARRVTFLEDPTVHDSTVATALSEDQASGELPTLEVDTVREAEAAAPLSMVVVIELLLKDRPRLNQLLRLEARQRELIPHLLAIALAGFFTYGVVATAILNAQFQQTSYWLKHLPAASWENASIANLTLSYTLGLIAANGICLPSFYFYGLLAGIRTTMLSVTAHALQGMAAGALALVGLLPIYVALALTALVFPQWLGWPLAWTVFGLALPFLAGLWGAINLYQGFVSLADTMPAACRTDRECFLRRLICAWCGCFTFVTPVVIFSLWDAFSGWTG